MSVRRVMGTETEMGISVQGQPTANPMVASSQIVNAYASSTLRARRARWDFEEESPLRDARGFDMSRETADPSQLTDEDLGLANVILTNGARLYVDHAHPEYSSPECTNPRDVVKWDKAGEQVMLELRDCRSLPDDRIFDKVAQVEMIEHVGIANHHDFYHYLRRHLSQRGLYFGQASFRRNTPNPADFPKLTPYMKFIVEYIFPGGELDHIGMTTGALERAREIALRYAAEARSHLGRTAHRPELEALTHIVVERRS